LISIEAEKLCMALSKEIEGRSLFGFLHWIRRKNT
jgi:hypothetical protein